MNIQQLKAFKDSPRYQTLVAEGARCFLSVRNAHGPLSQRILSELPVEDFFEGITKVDDDNAEGITGEDLMHFTVSVESMLKHFTDKIIDLINTGNNQLFNKFVEYGRDATFRAFAANYNRIMSGRNPNTDILMGIYGLYAHYFKEFKKNSDFRHDRHLKRFYDTERNRNVYPIDLIAENFAMLINVLCMNMMCEYYLDKENFAVETFLQDSINAIRDHLMTLFDTPTHRVEVDYGTKYIEQPVVDLYIVNLAFKHPEKLKDLELIIGEQISRETLIKYMKLNMVQKSNNSDVFHCDFSLPYRSLEYYEILTDLLSKLNHIEAMYLKLKQLSQVNSPDDENTAATLFHLYLKKPSESKELATI